MKKSMFKPAYGTDGTNDLWADTGKNAMVQ